MAAIVIETGAETPRSIKRRCVDGWLLRMFAIGMLGIVVGTNRSQGVHGIPPGIAPLLRKVADTNLDPGVHVAQAVETTRQLATRAALGSPGDTDQPAFLVVIRGNVVATKARAPHGQPYPGGTVISLVVDAATGPMWDFGVGNRVAV